MATIGFEEKLWASADKLRNNMDAAEYKHVVLGLIFLKYVSDTFMEKHREDNLNSQYWDIDCDCNLLNDLTGDYGFQEDRGTLKK